MDDEDDIPNHVSQRVNRHVINITHNNQATQTTGGNGFWTFALGCLGFAALTWYGSNHQKQVVNTVSEYFRDFTTPRNDRKITIKTSKPNPGIKEDDTKFSVGKEFVDDFIIKQIPDQKKSLDNIYDLCINTTKNQCSCRDLREFGNQNLLTETENVSGSAETENVSGSAASLKFLNKDERLNHYGKDFTTQGKLTRVGKELSLGESTFDLYDHERENMIMIAPRKVHGEECKVLEGDIPIWSCPLVYLPGDGRYFYNHLHGGVTLEDEFDFTEQDGTADEQQKEAMVSGDTMHKFTQDFYANKDVYEEQSND